MTDFHIDPSLFTWTASATVALPDDAKARLQLLETAVLRYSNAQQCQYDGEEFYRHSHLTHDPAAVIRSLAASHQGRAVVYSAGAELMLIGKALVAELTDKLQAEVASGPGGINEAAAKEVDQSMAKKAEGISTPHETVALLYGASNTHCCSCQHGGGGGMCTLHLGPDGEPGRCFDGRRNSACLGGERRLGGVREKEPDMGPEPKPIYTDGLREWWEVRKEKLESGWVIEWESPVAGEDGGHSGEKDKISLQSNSRGGPTLVLSERVLESNLVQAIRARYLRVKYQ